MYGTTRLEVTACGSSASRVPTPERRVHSDDSAEHGVFRAVKPGLYIGAKSRRRLFAYSAPCSRAFRFEVRPRAMV